MADLPAPLEREWLWAALQTLVDARGEDAFLRAPILLPTDEFFPDRWSPDEAGVARLAKRLLAYAGLGHLEVEVFTVPTQVREVGLDGRAAATSHAGVPTTAASARFTTSHHGLGTSYAHERQGYLAPHEMAFMLASQLALRGYGRDVIRHYAKQVPANQRATIRAAVAAQTRDLIANAMGFDRVPEATPPPAIPKPWWRVFG